MSGVDSDLIRGHIDTIILKVLSEGDKYGYEICKDVEEKSGGTYELKQPTLYSCLKRLEGQGLISSYWEDSDIGGKRHYYKLTDAGKEAYRKNQEDWLRSRQIIDNLISNSYEVASSYSLVKKEEIEELEKKAVINSIDDEIKSKEIDDIKESEQNIAPIISEEIVSNDNEDVIPWGNNQDEKQTDVIEQTNDVLEREDEEEITYSWNKFVDMSNDEQKILVEVAPNGEETAVYIDELNKEDTIQSEENIEEAEMIEEIEVEEISPAQSSLLEEDKVIFEEEIEDEIVESENLNEEYDEDVDILTLLGHKQTEEISYPIREQIEHNQEDLIEYSEEPKLDYSQALTIEHNQEELIEQVQEPMLEYKEKEPEYEQEESSPFNFNMDDFVTKSKNSYFDSEEDVAPDYIAPTMKIDNVEEENTTSSFDFEAFKEKHLDEDEIYSPFVSEEKEEEKQDNNFSTPVYHDFSSSSFDYKVNNIIDDEDDIYVDTSNVNEDEIYLNPLEAKSDDDENLKLFSEDIFEENNVFEETSSIDNNESFEESSYSNTEEIIRPENKEPMEFYKSTENYDSLLAKFTEDEYKEKLSSLMSYTNEKTEYNLKDKKYSFNNGPKDYSDLKAEFEKEGLVVRTHNKMVKESKQSRSYIESNKLNLVNSWTAFGFVSFLITLTYLIMNNYIGGGNATYNFSVKYFLFGILVLAVIPVLYTLLFFINPYKKKPARYASRIYLLFAILLTVQLLLIIYCLNLQAGFYSFSQANYNHLMWIIPSLMSLYPLFDAILHTIYFNSKNFHV